jgi:hypothetical protein
MSQLWQVLGRAYLEDPFHNAVKGTAIPKENDVSKLVDLKKALEDASHFATRWERGEVNRIFSLFQDSAGASAKARDVLRNAWAGLGTQPLPARPEQLWSVLGLASIDGAYQTRLANAALAGNPSTAIGNELAKSPAFSPSSQEFNALLRLLGQPAARNALKDLESAIWVVKNDAEEIFSGIAAAAKALADAFGQGQAVAKVPCSGGHSNVDANASMTAALHLDAPILDLLVSETLAPRLAR